MGRRESTRSPLARVATVTDDRVTQAFALLGNETRLAILLALWEASEPFADGTLDPTTGNSVSFSTLRKRVGMSDGSQFNYRLNQLVGTFVERSGDGYQLRPAGNQINRAVIASAGFEETTLAPTAVGVTCPQCDSPTIVTHQHHRLYHACTGCDGFVEMSESHPAGIIQALLLDPAAVHQRTPEELLSAAMVWKNTAFAQQVGGVCGRCSGPVERTIRLCDAHDVTSGRPCPECGVLHGATAGFVCTLCRHAGMTSFVDLSLLHPAVVSCCWDNDITLGYGGYDQGMLDWLMELYATAEQEILSTEPPRVRVTIGHGDAASRLTYDESRDVTEITPTG